jgi:midasin
MTENLNNYSNLKFNFEYKNRIITCNFDENNYFTIETPFLKVLKPMHVSFNKKKNSTKRYIILEVNENYDVNKEMDDFLIKINKLHELSQENVRKNSLLWFNTEFDDIGLDLKVKKPIDIQKDKQFIKILIPDNEELLEKINNLEKNDYINCTIFYKGLRVSNEYLMGEYELSNYLTQDEYEQIQKVEVNDDMNDEIYEDVINENAEEINENNENEIDKNNEKDIEKNDKLENQDLENKTIENTENTENHLEENLETNLTIETESVTSKTSKKNKKTEEKNNKYVKIVSRKKKILILK